jgi:hypothetical protein
MEHDRLLRDPDDKPLTRAPLVVRLVIGTASVSGFDIPIKWLWQSSVSRQCLNMQAAFACSLFRLVFFFILCRWAEVVIAEFLGTLMFVFFGAGTASHFV